jgi:hypothetical protein
MSARGQSRRFCPIRAMSALPPIATKQRTSRDVRNVSEADMAPLFDNFICGSPILNLYLIGARAIKGQGAIICAIGPAFF